MPTAFCQCCRERPGNLRAIPQLGRAVPALVTLCHRCVTHTTEACIVCPAPVFRWRCSWVAHFAEAHPLLMEKFRNDEFPELQRPPTQRTIGTVRF